MGTTYAVHCATCGKSSGDTWAKDALHQLVAQRERVGQMLELAASLPVEIKFEWSYDGPGIDDEIDDPLYFVAEHAHASHQLAVMDEYGRVYEGKQSPA